MGCNCGSSRRPAGVPPRTKPGDDKQTGTTQSFALVTDRNERFVYGSRLEADAARVRLTAAGQTGRVIPL